MDDSQKLLARWNELDSIIASARTEQLALEAQMPYTLDNSLSFWYSAKASSDVFKDKENTLRKGIFDKEFPEPVKGTNKKRIDHGMALVAKYKINYSVDRALLDTMIKDAETAELIHTVIRFDPKVKETEWLALSDNEKKVLAPLITEKPGMPELEIKPQKNVRWK